jgi:hypothetical protein
MAMAFLDRLVEGAIILQLKSKSYRVGRRRPPSPRHLNRRAATLPSAPSCARTWSLRNLVAGPFFPAKNSPIFWRH